MSSLQLERLREAAEAQQRAEAAAKAVLAAATAAAREGRPLSAAERAAAEKPILFAEQYAAEQEAQRAAEEQVLSVSSRTIYLVSEVLLMPLLGKTTSFLWDEHDCLTCTSCKLRPYV